MEVPEGNEKEVKGKESELVDSKTEKENQVKSKKKNRSKNKAPISKEETPENKSSEDEQKQIEQKQQNVKENPEDKSAESESQEEVVPVIEESLDDNYHGDDDGDPIPSGTGSVSKDCSPSELVGWSEILPKWHSKLNQRPKGLETLVRNGIPEPLRGEVWQLLSGAQQSVDLMERYRIFLTLSAPTEQIILRDVHRTYPAHESFQAGGSGSLLDSLFKVCKAYAVYDEEVGYCQGLSFLVAALLLHMPEEQAFCVFARIMQNYGLRNLFRNNFDELYLKFYQLEHLLEDHMPDLYQHFSKMGIEPFTYASQWFLTLFTAKFPLNAVFYIMDLFLLDGMDTIFQVALALLGSSRQDLLDLDFEGVLKYFRVQMPKKYRNQANVQQLIMASSEISIKKLKKHAKNYEIMKRREKLLENPLTRLQKENAKLTEKNLQLQQENDDLACDLVASKVHFQAQLDALEDRVEYLTRTLKNSQDDCNNHAATISDIEDEKARLEVEATQLKEVCRRELLRAESESARDNSIISDYKKICSQLSRRLERQSETCKKFVESIQDSLRDNEYCQDRTCQQIFETRAEQFLASLNSDDNQDNKPNDNSKSESLRRLSNDSNNSSNRPVGALIKSSNELQASSNEVKILHLTRHIDDLEVELARTKLALVEAECKNQQLIHDLSAGATVSTSSPSSSSGQTATGFTGRLQFVKAAMNASRSPKVTANTFAKINNLIGERISTLGAQMPSQTGSIQSSVSSPAIDKEANVALASAARLQEFNKNNNNSNSAINQYKDQNQC